MRSGRERLIVLGGGVTGELQDTWEGIQRRLRGEHEGVRVCVFTALQGCEGAAVISSGAVVCVSWLACVCFDGVIAVGRGMEDLLVSIVPLTFGLLWL